MTTLDQINELERRHAELCADINTSSSVFHGDRYADPAQCYARDRIWAKLCGLREQWQAELEAEEQRG